MIAIIRIDGQIKVRRSVAETLDRLRMRKKYTTVVISESKENLGMLAVVRDQVAYGKIADETFVKLIEARGQPIDKTKKKVDAKKVVEEVQKGKKFEDFNLKPFFRLHPPRKGINAKIHYPNGVLGDNGADINKLIERML